MTRRPSHRRFAKTTVILLLVVLVVYEFAIPAFVGDDYLSRLDPAVLSLDKVLAQTASTGSSSQFADPDLPFNARIEQTDLAVKSVAVTRTALSEFETKAKTLPDLPADGWFGDYQKALVKRSQALRLVLQSREVLDNYEQALKFIASYSALQRNLDNYYTSLTLVSDFDTLGGQGDTMSATAAAIRADGSVLADLAVPPDFAKLKTEAQATFDQMAKGFDHMAYGLNIAVNSEIYAADAEIVAAGEKNRLADKNLLVALVDKSPTFSRLAELAEKSDYVEPSFVEH